MKSFLFIIALAEAPAEAEVGPGLAVCIGLDIAMSAARIAGDTAHHIAFETLADIAVPATAARPAEHTAEALLDIAVHIVAFETPVAVIAGSALRTACGIVLRIAFDIPRFVSDSLADIQTSCSCMHQRTALLRPPVPHDKHVPTCSRHFHKQGRR